MLLDNTPAEIHWIFTLNWIFIDIIIIILLIFFLIAVKLFKATHRWRSSYSNLNLQQSSYKNELIFPTNQSVFLKGMKIIKNAIQNIASPVIVIFRTNSKLKLNHILSEGLSSYGYCIIQVKIKINPCKGCDIFDISIKNEMKYLISGVINFFFRAGLILEKKYCLISYSKSNFSYSTILNDDNNKNLILLNPKINKVNLRNFQESQGNIDKVNYMNIIFSKKSILFFKNINLDKCTKVISNMKINQSQIKIIEKARKSFKYYETILLSLIIEYIKKIE